MKSLWLLFLFIILSGNIAFAQSQSGPLAYEPFSNTNSPLQGSASGYGWASPWTVQNNDQSVPGYGLAGATPLQYSGLQQSGAYAVGGSMYQTSGRALDTSASGPFASYLSSGSIGATGSSIWFSALLRKDTNANDELSLTLVPGGPAWWAGNGHISIGSFGSASKVGNIAYWSLKVDGQVYTTASPVVVGQPALLVLRIDFGGSTAARLFVNPPLNATDPGTAAAQAAVTDSLAFNCVAFYGGDVAGEGSVDEIRLGGTYSQVAPQLVTAAAPQNLTAVSGDGQVNLSWNAAAGASGYNIYQSTQSGFVIVGTQSGSNTFSLPGLTDGTSYSFYVTAINNAGESTPSNTVIGTPQSGLATNPPGLLAHEPFQEKDGALSGANGGAGWASSWAVQNDSVAQPGLTIVSSSPPVYSGLPQSGNYASGGYQFYSAGRGFDLTAQGPFRNFISGGSIGKAGTTLWMSALMREDSASQDPFYLALHSGNPVWSIGASGVRVGYFGFDSYNSSTSTGYWSLNVDGTVYKSSTPVVIGQPALLVIRIDFGSTTTVSMYVNPPVGNTAPARADIQVTSSNSQAFKSIGYASGYNSNQNSLDEIRLAADYGTLLTSTAVVPTPPATVTTTSANGQITLSWSPGGEASGYQVWGSADGTHFSLLATVNGTTYTQTGLTNNATYSYYVTTLTGAGVSLGSSQVATVPRTPVAPPHPQLGTNLTAISDWTRQWPFVDIFKLARAWIPQQQDGKWGQGPPLQLTPDGWPASLQPGQYAETIIFDNQLEDSAADYPVRQLHPLLRWGRHNPIRSGIGHYREPVAGANGGERARQQYRNFPKDHANESVQPAAQHPVHHAWICEHLSDPTLPSAVPEEPAELSCTAVYGMGVHQ